MSESHFLIPCKVKNDFYKGRLLVTRKYVKQGEIILIEKPIVFEENHSYYNKSDIKAFNSINDIKTESFVNQSSISANQSFKSSLSILLIKVILKVMNNELTIEQLSELSIGSITDETIPSSYYDRKIHLNEFQVCFESIKTALLRVLRKCQPKDLPSTLPTWLTLETCYDLYERIKCNIFTMVDDYNIDMGIGLFLSAAIINHSCAPNAVQYFDRETGTIQFRALYDINIDEEVAISYIDIGRPLLSRRAELFSSYRFICQCTRCLIESDPDTTTTTSDVYSDRLLCPNISCRNSHSILSNGGTKGSCEAGPLFLSPHPTHFHTQRVVDLRINTTTNTSEKELYLAWLAGNTASLPTHSRIITEQIRYIHPYYISTVPSGVPLPDFNAILFSVYPQHFPSPAPGAGVYNTNTDLYLTTTPDITCIYCAHTLSANTVSGTYSNLLKHMRELQQYMTNKHTSMHSFIDQLLSVYREKTCNDVYNKYSSLFQQVQSDIIPSTHISVIIMTSLLSKLIMADIKAIVSYTDPTIHAHTSLEDAYSGITACTAQHHNSSSSNGICECTDCSNNRRLRSRHRMMLRPLLIERCIQYMTLSRRISPGLTQAYEYITDTYYMRSIKHGNKAIIYGTLLHYMLEYVDVMYTLYNSLTAEDTPLYAYGKLSITVPVPDSEMIALGKSMIDLSAARLMLEQCRDSCVITHGASHSLTVHIQHTLDSL